MAIKSLIGLQSKVAVIIKAGKEFEIEIKEVKEAPEGAIAKELGSRAAPKAQVEQITVMKWKGTEYLLGPKKGSGGLVFELFEMVDDKLTKPLGEISINPGTGTFKGSKPIMKI